MDTAPNATPFMLVALRLPQRPQCREFDYARRLVCNVYPRSLQPSFRLILSNKDGKTALTPEKITLKKKCNCVCSFQPKKILDSVISLISALENYRRLFIGKLICLNSRVWIETVTEVKLWLSNRSSKLLFHTKHNKEFII